MIVFPQSTEIARRIPKQKLYDKASLTPKLQKAIKEQIGYVFWQNKLAENTIGISAGETVKEIQVFKIILEHRKFDTQILSAIVKAIPYKIVFILQYRFDFQLWIEVAGAFYYSKVLPKEALTLKIEGLNLDDVFANFVRQIAGEGLPDDTDLEKAVDKDRQIKKLTLQIEKLEKKMAKEKQFNRQVEINEEIKRLRDVLLSLTETQRTQRKGRKIR